MINVNGSEDNFYRYKMNKVSVTNKGFGNGLITTINNLDEISKSINTPSEVLYKYIATNLGTNYNDKTKSLTGKHTQDKIQETIYSYINSFVICSKCGIPEINYTIKTLSKKNCIVEPRCSACGSVDTLKDNNKINQKTIDIILKYLQKNNTWINTKGNMVSQSSTFLNGFNIETYGEEVDQFNEFNKSINSDQDSSEN